MGSDELDFSMGSDELDVLLGINTSSSIQPRLCVIANASDKEGTYR